MGRVAGLALLALIFAGSAFLLTCQKQPGMTGQHAPHSVAPEKQAQVTPPADRAAEKPSEEKDEPASEEPKSEEVETKPEEQQPAERETESAPQPANPTPEEPVKPEPAVERPGKKSRPSPVVRGMYSEVSRGNPNSTKVALTFDAGADFRPAVKILDTLAAHNVRATFFLTGKWIEKNRGLTKRIVAEGHEIGNHTYSHRSLTQLSSGQIADEVEKTEKLVLDVTGQSTKPYLRVPYGARNKRVLAILADLGYQSIYWDLDCWDAVKKGITPKQIEERVTSKIRNGSIVLMHCGSQATADALDSLLRNLESAGYRSVTVSDLLNS